MHIVIEVTTSSKYTHFIDNERELSTIFFHRYSSSFILEVGMASQPGNPLHERATIIKDRAHQPNEKGKAKREKTQRITEDIQKQNPPTKKEYNISSMFFIAKKKCCSKS